MENYQVFATVYDDLMDKELYQKWLDYVKKRLPKESNILELASGAGDLAVLLNETGYQITVSDLSESMLELAADKLAANPENISYLQIDMRDFNFTNQYDGIICFDDSICYLKDEAEVLTVLKNAYASLKSGGKFLFDCHSLYQMDEIFPEYMFNEINEDYTFVWQSYPGEVEHSIEHDLQIFVANDEYYQKFEEFHFERTYPVETYQRLIAEAGFNLVSVTSDFTEDFDEQTGRRWFFECEKIEK